MLCHSTAEMVRQRGHKQSSCERLAMAEFTLLFDSGWRHNFFTDYDRPYMVETEVRGDYAAPGSIVALVE